MPELGRFAYPQGGWVHPFRGTRFGISVAVFFGAGLAWHLPRPLAPSNLEVMLQGMSEKEGHNDLCARAGRFANTLLPEDLLNIT